MSQIDKITETIGTKFRTFGGGQRRKFDNPVAAAFADRPLMFAANVDVKTVVIAVLELFVSMIVDMVEKKTKKSS